MWIFIVNFLLNHSEHRETSTTDETAYFGHLSRSSPTSSGNNKAAKYELVT